MFDKGILDRFVNFVGDGAEDSGKAMKRVQNGNVETYILIMSLAVGIILIVNFYYNNNVLFIINIITITSSRFGISFCVEE